MLLGVAALRVEKLQDMPGRRRCLPSASALALVVILTGALRLLNAQTQITPNFPRQDWQPTRAIYGWRYVGDKVCAACHPAEALSQPRTAMALALSPVSDSQVLRSHPNLQVRLGGYD
ncbi:MAG: hypothetical protein ACRD3O_21805, partial [Terriglobia bacterium]